MSKINVSLLDKMAVKKMAFTAIIKKGEKQFVALCPELDVVSQGFTVESAIANLKEAVELYTSYFQGELKYG